MTTAIKTQLNKNFVGEWWEGIVLDLRPTGVTGPDEILHLTNLSDQPVLWQGNEYSPFPYEIDGISRETNSAPNRITLRVSNVNRSLAGLIIQYGDLVGAKLSIYRTLKVFMDGQPQANPNQHLPIQKYIIIQKSSFNNQQIEFLATSILDKPTDLLPKRQILIDQTSNSLYAPGVSRINFRNR
jgi:lambda family phage minor tail protein L